MNDATTTNEIDSWTPPANLEAIEAKVRSGASALGGSVATLFLLSPDRRSLEGAILGWDWTRTSFSAELAYWPNVDDAIAHNRTVSIDETDALSHEIGWFERGGIHATVCVPMCDRDRVVGVLFFDDPKMRAAGNLAAAKTIADDCAALIAQAA
jgi:GAF domain-containing protein